MFFARISTYFKLNPQKISPAAAKFPISAYFRVFELISEFFRDPPPPPGGVCVDISIPLVQEKLGNKILWREVLL